MNLDDMFAEPKVTKLSDDDISKLWPQARGELSGFANALDKRGAGITAAQLRMAVQLADEAYQGRGLK